jgi:hypothetical protein
MLQCCKVSLTCGRCRVVRRRVAPPWSQPSSARWRLAHSDNQCGCFHTVALYCLCHQTLSCSPLLSFQIPVHKHCLFASQTSKSSHVSTSPCSRPTAHHTSYVPSAVWCGTAAQDRPAVALIKTHENRTANCRTFWL